MSINWIDCINSQTFSLLVVVSKANFFLLVGVPVGSERLLLLLPEDFGVPSEASPSESLATMLLPVDFLGDFLVGGFLGDSLLLSEAGLMK